MFKINSLLLTLAVFLSAFSKENYKVGVCYHSTDYLECERWEKGRLGCIDFVSIVLEVGKTKCHAMAVNVNNPKSEIFEFDERLWVSNYYEKTQCPKVLKELL